MSPLHSLKSIGLFLTFLAAYLMIACEPSGAQTEEAEPAPPANQTYIGTKKCAACHFNQFLTWKKSKHSKTFDLLPAKYQTDVECLKCHTTGYGEETGYKTLANKDLQGTTCEACHGPGSEHEAISKKFANQKPTPAQEKQARDSIWKMLPKNVCVTCHVVQAHKDNPTPPALRKTK